MGRSGFRSALAELLGGPADARLAANLSSRYFKGELTRPQVYQRIEDLGASGEFDSQVLKDQFERAVRGTAVRRRS